MNKVAAVLSLILMSSTVFAGSYNYDCTAYNLDKETGEISKLSMSRDSADLNGESLVNVDPNLWLMAGEQVYQSEDKKIVIKATVTSTKEIASLDGSMGRRQHTVETRAVAIKLIRQAVTTEFAGSCTEETVTTCGGPCN